MTKDYKNDKMSKSNVTKRQAQKNSQNIKDLWVKKKAPPPPTNSASTSTPNEAVQALQNEPNSNNEIPRIQVDPPGEREDEQMSECAGGRTNESTRELTSRRAGGRGDPTRVRTGSGMDGSLSRQESNGVGGNSNEGGRGDYNYGDGGGDGGGGDEEGNSSKQRRYWPEHMYDFFDAVKATVDANAEFKGRGSTARFEGTMPTEYCQEFLPASYSCLAT